MTAINCINVTDFGSRLHFVVDGISVSKSRTDKMTADEAYAIADYYFAKWLSTENSSDYFDYEVWSNSAIKISQSEVAA